MKGLFERMGSFERMVTSWVIFEGMKSFDKFRRRMGDDEIYLIKIKDNGDV